jgi:hypothetical protein
VACSRLARGTADSLGPSGRRVGRLPALVVAGLLAAGCGAESKEADAPPAEIGSARARATAQRLVDRHWRAVINRDSALPLFYDERILHSIPAGELDIAFYSLSGQFAVRPRVVAVEQTPLGVSVTTESKPDGSTPIRAGYLMRRIGTEWKILYDTNLALGLDRLAGTARRLRDPEAPPLDPGDPVAPYLRLRELYLPGRSGGRLLRNRPFPQQPQDSG